MAQLKGTEGACLPGGPHWKARLISFPGSLSKSPAIPWGRGPSVNQSQLQGAGRPRPETQPRREGRSGLGKTRAKTRGGATLTSVPLNATVPSPCNRTQPSSPQNRILKEKCTANVSSQIKRKRHGQLLIKHHTSAPQVTGLLCGGVNSADSREDLWAECGRAPVLCFLKSPAVPQGADHVEVLLLPPESSWDNDSDFPGWGPPHPIRGS